MKKATIALLLICTVVFAQQKGTFTDSRDGKKYKTVKIGSQTWMAENLNYDAKGSKCYDNKPVNCAKYGRLYDWKTAMTVCPKGWHLPSNEEWDYLYNAVINSTGSFLNVERRGDWWSATEATKYGSDYAYYWLMGYDDENMYYGHGKSTLFSVRCLQIDKELENAAKKKAEMEAIEKAEKVAKEKAEIEARKAAAQSSFIDSRDGKNYKTVKIGEQVWMAENLNYDASASKCYDHEPVNCEKYGRLYNWETAIAACPKGWHLPSKSEWEELDKTVGGIEVAGKTLKAKSGWYNNGNGTDEFGFSALPGGLGHPGGSFLNAGYLGSWWSASEYDANFAYYRGMECNYENAIWHLDVKSYLLNVRCVQD